MNELKSVKQIQGMSVANLRTFIASFACVSKETIMANDIATKKPLIKQALMLNDAAAAVAFNASENTPVDSDSDVAKMITLVRENLTAGSDFMQKAHESYDKVLTDLQLLNVKWSDIHVYIQTVVFTDWPVKTLKDNSTKPLGYQAAREAGYKGANVLNRFNTYRNQFTDYGVKRETAGATTPTAPEEDHVTQHEADKVLDTPIVFKKGDVPTALILMFHDLNQNGAEDFIKEAVETLAVYYKVELPDC